MSISYSTIEEDLKNIIKQNVSKVNELKKILEISLKIKDTVEKQSEESVEEIVSLVDKRGECVEAIKNIDITVKYYISKLPVKYSSIIEKTSEIAKARQKLPSSSNLEWVVNLYKIIIEQQILLIKIKEIDEVNDGNIKILMNEFKDKINTIKNNKILIRKFIPGENGSTGTLYNKKK